MLKSSGRIIAMKGPHIYSEFDRVSDELQALGFEISSVYQYSLPMNKGERSLLTVTAVNSCG